MKSNSRRIAFSVAMTMSALALASCTSGGGGAGSGGLPPMKPAARLANPNTLQPAIHAPKVSIKEIVIPAGNGPSLGGIAVTSDSSVYLSLDGSGSPLFSIGAVYAKGTFTTLIIDPFFAGPAVGPVAATPNDAAHIATGISTNFCYGQYVPHCAAIASFGPPAAEGAFGITGVQGTISDMAEDFKGNLWFAATPDYYDSPAIVGKVPQDSLNAGGCCDSLSGETQVALNYSGNLSTSALAVAPNGDAWVAAGTAFSELNHSIFHISAAGAIVHAYPIPNGTDVNGMVVAPDGALWFTDSGHNFIRRLSRLGKFSRFAIPTADSGVDRIVVGPDGALWFTEKSANKIGRITLRGRIHEYGVPTANAQPAGIASLGPGCNPSTIWFVEQNTNKLAMLTIK